MKLSENVWVKVAQKILVEHQTRYLSLQNYVKSLDEPVLNLKNSFTCSNIQIYPQDFCCQIWYIETSSSWFLRHSPSELSLNVKVNIDW